MAVESLILGKQNARNMSCRTTAERAFRPEDIELQDTRKPVKTFFTYTISSVSHSIFPQKPSLTIMTDVFTRNNADGDFVHVSKHSTAAATNKHDCTATCKHCDFTIHSFGMMTLLTNIYFLIYIYFKGIIRV